jgi:hypothetical protein
MSSVTGVSSAASAAQLYLQQLQQQSQQAEGHPHHHHHKAGGVGGVDQGQAANPLASTAADSPNAAIGSSAQSAGAVASSGSILDLLA